MFRASMKNMALLRCHMAKRGLASREPRGPIIEGQATQHHSAVSPTRARSRAYLISRGHLNCLPLTEVTVYFGVVAYE